MDKAKLEKLRKLFGEADGSVYLTERFKHVGEKLADRPHSSTKPFAGVSTFLDMPHQPQFEGLDVALVGVPMDLGVTNRAGARYGPRAVRAMERIGPYSHALDEVPRGVLKAADIGDVPMRRPLDQLPDCKSARRERTRRHGAHRRAYGYGRRL